MKTRFSLLIHCMCVILYISCFEGSDRSKINVGSKNKLFQDSINNKLMFAKSIYKIDEEMQDAITWKYLYEDELFMKIYENPSFYKDIAIAFIKNDTNTVVQKTMAVYSIQNLKLENYLSVLRTAKDLFIKKKIPELLLERIITPTFGKTKIIMENYDNPNVQYLLKEIQSGHLISDELNETIDSILSGEMLKDIKQFEEESGNNG